MTEERALSGKGREAERAFEATLRPRRLADYIGQDKLKDNLQIVIEAAKARKEALDHLLFYGPPGLGKTTISNVIAAEMGVHIRVTSGPAIERAGDLVAILTNLKKEDILFIDEIHRLNRTIEEVLYPAMEDFAVDLITGKGPSAQSIHLRLPKFTIVGATTRLALLTAPLRDRFGAVFRLEFYDQKAMELIVTRSAGILRVEIDAEGASEIARRSRGTPRVANRLLKRVRDYAQVRADGKITKLVAAEALFRLDVDELGLDDGDRRVLSAIIDKFDGGPVGIETIAASTSEEVDAVMDVYEPYLLQLGFIVRTPRGRVVTQQAYDHLGKKPSLRARERLGLLEEQPPQATLWGTATEEEA
ncbi:MAG: Holliday junction branch migration DNA helicase RuvB [Chloroflexi bacterium]|nr:Holliday junction branch migration DNA helicase RuvB [Chloroflexota bacterium]